MNTTNPTPKPAADAAHPTELTAEQAAQVGGGLYTPVGSTHICCMTCASVGLPKFAMLAATV